MVDIQNYKNLGCAIAIQAAKDYMGATPAMRKVILKDLRSPYMDLVTGGIAPMLADALRNDYKTVVARIKNMEYEEELQCATQ